MYTYIYVTTTNRRGGCKFESWGVDTWQELVRRDMGGGRKGKRESDIIIHFNFQDYSG